MLYFKFSTRLPPVICRRKGQSGVFCRFAAQSVYPGRIGAVFIAQSAKMFNNKNKKYCGIVHFAPSRKKATIYRMKIANGKKNREKIRREAGAYARVPRAFLRTGARTLAGCLGQKAEFLGKRVYKCTRCKYNI